MNSVVDVTPTEIESLFEQLKKDAKSSGYHLNPDETFTKELIRGLIINQERYGYASSPSGPPLGVMTVAYPVWRCKVCGYLCAREQPPDVCPICKAGKDSFERFL
jgi:rubrerythrin